MHMIRLFTGTLGILASDATVKYIMYLAEKFRFPPVFFSINIGARRRDDSEYLSYWLLNVLTLSMHLCVYAF